MLEVYQVAQNENMVDPTDVTYSNCNHTKRSMNEKVLKRSRFLLASNFFNRQKTKIFERIPIQS